jgi:hypothetical protein
MRQTVSYLVILEEAIGTIDGVNSLFRTSAPYIQDSLYVFLNGLLKKRDWDDGWEEIDEYSFRLKEAPQFGDTVYVIYHSGDP